MAKYPFTKSCEHCSNNFVIYKSKARKQRFCSPKCVHAHKTIRTRLTNCVNCGKTLIKDQAKFCSHSCSAHVTNTQRDRPSVEQKQQVSLKLLGHKASPSSVLKGILTKGQHAWHLRPNNKCLNCNADTGNSKRKCCSETCRKQYLKLKSQLNPKCGGQKHTNRSQISNQRGQLFTAESSFEVRVANILNNLNIHWIRPSYVWYQDSENKRRRYYPDFFLSDHNLYLDPKNDYLIATDSDKIRRASEANNITIVILSESQITEEFVKNLLGKQN